MADDKPWSVLSEGETELCTWTLQERPKGTKGNRMEYRGTVRAKATKFEYTTSATSLTFIDGAIAGAVAVHDAMESYINRIEKTS